MFKDTDEALARFEAELLQEEETKKIPTMELCTEEEEWINEEPVDEEILPPEFVYTDTRAADGPVVYQNYSNNYGKDLRNYATGYRAYNSDVLDEDLQAFSDDVLQTEPEKRNTPLILIACALLLGIVAVLIYWLFLFRGFL